LGGLQEAVIGATELLRCQTRASDTRSRARTLDVPREKKQQQAATRVGRWQVSRRSGTYKVGLEAHTGARKGDEPGARYLPVGLGRTEAASQECNFLRSAIWSRGAGSGLAVSDANQRPLPVPRRANPYPHDATHLPRLPSDADAAANGQDSLEAFALRHLRSFSMSFLARLAIISSSFP
jgi:hypothetical protein